MPPLHLHNPKGATQSWVTVPESAEVRLDPRTSRLLSASMGCPLTPGLQCAARHQMARGRQPYHPELVSQALTQARGAPSTESGALSGAYERSESRLHSCASTPLPAAAAPPSESCAQLAFSPMGFVSADHAAELSPRTRRLGDGTPRAQRQAVATTTEPVEPGAAHTHGRRSAGSQPLPALERRTQAPPARRVGPPCPRRVPHLLARCGEAQLPQSDPQGVHVGGSYPPRMRSMGMASRAPSAPPTRAIVPDGAC